jgi:hypothetical protein
MALFRHHRRQKDMTQPVNTLTGKVITGKIELESASEVPDTAGKLVSVELGYCAGGLLEIISRDHFYFSSKFRLTLCKSVFTGTGFCSNFQNLFCEAQHLKNFFVFGRLV